MTFAVVELGPRETGSSRSPSSRRRRRVAPRLVERRFGDELLHVRESLAAWRLRVPQLRAGWERPLALMANQSVADLAALRMRSSASALREPPPAGMPPFMTVFGRDTIITCLQTMLSADLHAPRWTRSRRCRRRRTTDRRRARQDRARDPHRQGREALVRGVLRHGRRHAAVPRSALGGVALTGRRAVVRLRCDPALLAMRWIDEWGDRRRRRVRRVREAIAERARQPVLEGLGRLAALFQTEGWRSRRSLPPRCNYVYDAKRRARSSRRAVWRDRALADRLTREADELRDRFDEAFWVDARGGYFALALDRDKKKVDSMASNKYLLWSGSPAPDCVDSRRRDDERRAWSGWGVRRCRRRTPATTRSATTTARSGLTTTR